MTQYVQEKVASMERPVTAWVLVGAAIVFLVLYGYFVNGAIVNIVATRDMQAQIADLTSKVGSLESTYLAAKSSITADYAHALGFDTANVNASYIAKRSIGALSFNQ